MKTMLDNSAGNAPVILHDTKRLQSCFAAIAVFFLPMHSALACIREEDSFNFPLFLIFSAMMIFVVAMFALLSWSIKKIFFQKFSWFPLVFTLSLLLSLALGIFGTFGISQYEPIFAIFGEDLPRGTQILLNVRQLLWLPSILTAWLYYSTREKPNKTFYFTAILVTEAGLSAFIGSLIFVSICKTMVI